LEEDGLICILIHGSSAVLSAMFLMYYFPKKQCEGRPAKAWRLNQRLYQSQQRITKRIRSDLRTTYDGIGIVVFSVVCHTRSQMLNPAGAGWWKEREAQCSQWLGDASTTNHVSRLGCQYWLINIRTNVSPIVQEFVAGYLHVSILTRPRFQTRVSILRSS
jgi:hypothetical protein